jgi:hypothetical protein
VSIAHENQRFKPVLKAGLQDSDLYEAAAGEKACYRKLFCLQRQDFSSKAKMNHPVIKVPW